MYTTVERFKDQIVNLKHPTGTCNEAYIPDEYLPPGVVLPPVYEPKKSVGQKMSMAQVANNITAEAKYRNSLLLALKAYGERSSVVGLSYIADSKSKNSRRFCWILLLIFGLVMLSIQLTAGIKLLMSRPIHSVVKVVYEPSLQFPAVTICNFNMFRKSYITNLGKDYEDYIDKLYPTENGHNNAKSNDFNFETIDHLNMSEFYYQAGHQKHDMIKLCEWQGRPCSPEDFDSSLTDFGLCHTFNSGEHSPATVVYNKGARFGLRLELDVEIYEYMAGPHTSVGFKVLLHHQLDIPRGLANDLGFVVGPGTHNVAEVHVSKIYNLEEPFGDCGTRKLEHVTPYSIMGCYLDCQTSYVINQCNCKNAFMPGDFPVCSPSQQFFCSGPTMDQYVQQVDRHCSCPVPCHRVLFVPRVSSNLFPAPAYNKNIQHRDNVTDKDYAKKNILELVIYFEDLKFTETTQNAAYKWYDLLADIGGSMGIFLGISILSVFEFLDYMFRTFQNTNMKT
ncbi:acid-sensing ion channel 1-like [Antedon mediterranea]|uniref:acid-sensing ion channel 1-like n=1 Tax=Antedon mediterranea TaxID=105859 RepID=UPI003AF7E411